MDKKKIGNLVYYLSITISIVVLLLILFLIKTDDPVKLSIYRYFACFFCFGVIIPIGLVVREYLIGEYILKKILIKVGVIFVTAIGGVFGVIYVTIAPLGLILFLVSLLVLMFMIVPTVPKEK